jgi:hypothetical protein
VTVRTPLVRPPALREDVSAGHHARAVALACGDRATIFAEATGATVVVASGGNIAPAPLRALLA